MLNDDMVRLDACLAEVAYAVMQLTMVTHCFWSYYWCQKKKNSLIQSNSTFKCAYRK